MRIRTGAVFLLFLWERPGAFVAGEVVVKEV
jgi:hypothetical protein